MRKTIQVSLSYKESHFFDLSPVSLSSCSVKSSLRISWVLEPLGNYCINPLRMLYYKCCRLNGLGSPFGIETKT